MFDARVTVATLVLVVGLLALPRPAQGCEQCEEAAAAREAQRPAVPATPAAPTARPGPATGTGGGTLPAGHPPIDQAPTMGTIVVRAVQGTPDGDPIGDSKVVIALQGHGHGNEAQTKIDARLDEHGVVMLEDVEFRGAVQPLVSVEHAGVTYRAAGPIMSAQQPDQIVRVKVYDLADEPPDWHVNLRHLFVQPTPEGLIVDEVLVIDNPADRAWQVTDANDGDQLATLTLPLPAGATDVQLARGPDKMAVLNDALAMRGPLVPGRTEIGFRYRLPLADASSELALTAPALTTRIMLFVPADSGEVVVEGLEAGETMDHNGRAIRIFSATDVPAGEVGMVRIKTRFKQGATSNQIELSSSSPMRTTTIAGALVLGVALMVVVLRSGSRARGPLVTPEGEGHEQSRPD